MFVEIVKKSFGVPEERHKFMPFLWNSRVFKQLLTYKYG